MLARPGCNCGAAGPARQPNHHHHRPKKCRGCLPCLHARGVPAPPPSLAQPAGAAPAQLPGPGLQPPSGRGCAARRGEETALTGSAAVQQGQQPRGAMGAAQRPTRARTAAAAGAQRAQSGRRGWGGGGGGCSWLAGSSGAAAGSVVQAAKGERGIHKKEVLEDWPGLRVVLDGGRRACVLVGRRVCCVRGEGGRALLLEARGARRHARRESALPFVGGRIFSRALGWRGTDLSIFCRLCRLHVCATPPNELRPTTITTCTHQQCVVAPPRARDHAQPRRCAHCAGGPRPAQKPGVHHRLQHPGGGGVPRRYTVQTCHAPHAAPKRRAHSHSRCAAAKRSRSLATRTWAAWRRWGGQAPGRRRVPPPADASILCGWQAAGRLHGRGPTWRARGPQRAGESMRRAVRDGAASPPRQRDRARTCHARSPAEGGCGS